MTATPETRPSRPQTGLGAPVPSAEHSPQSKAGVNPPYSAPEDTSTRLTPEPTHAPEHPVSPEDPLKTGATTPTHRKIPFWVKVTSGAVAPVAVISFALAIAHKSDGEATTAGIAATASAEPGATGSAEATAAAKPGATGSAEATAAAPILEVKIPEVKIGSLEKVIFSPNPLPLEPIEGIPGKFKPLDPEFFAVLFSKNPNPEQAVAASYQMEVDVHNAGLGANINRQTINDTPDGPNGEFSQAIISDNIADAVVPAYLQAQYGTANEAQLNVTFQTAQGEPLAEALRKRIANNFQRQVLGTVYGDTTKPPSLTMSNLECNQLGKTAFTCTFIGSGVNNMAETGIPHGSTTWKENINSTSTETKYAMKMAVVMGRWVIVS
ncbi:hypothetical protein IPL85_02000 [Candidatus Saccharibacteria bacterium]|nr:MAG: hypothetical protein IPL85_02000 [Candidatus Saccharibacteria bacterium]